MPIETDAEIIVRFYREVVPRVLAFGSAASLPQLSPSWLMLDGKPEIYNESQHLGATLMVGLTTSLKVDIKQVHLTDEQFYQLCTSNPELAIERSVQGILIFTSPVGGESGSQEADFIIDLGNWNRQTGLGKVFSSSTLFKLPEGRDRSPDAAWIELSRWESLTAQQRKKFPPIAPDFVIELRSQTDDLATLQEKMQEYMDSGVKLGWMFNPQDQQVEIYRQGQAKEVRSLPTELSGETILPGFTLQVERFED